MVFLPFQSALIGESVSREKPVKETIARQAAECAPGEAAQTKERKRAAFRAMKTLANLLHDSPEAEREENRNLILLVD